MGLYTHEDNSILRIAIRAIVYFIVLISFAWFLVYGFMGQTIISGQSMSPILHAEDVCLVNKLAYDIGNPKRFDIVVFERQDTGKQNVKRIIGLPGEAIQIVDGSIYINGEITECESIDSISLSGIAENIVELGKDEYFVLGDNADSSEDSRFANIGNVKRRDIKGKLWLKIVPLKELRLIK
ncbi:MAG: signal peptidase I [Eubacteriales bacterium]|nr:signal peptidase I [Eubacteriales bacterium]